MLAELEGTIFTYGKGQANIDVDESDEKQIWKKQSIFFDLEYLQFDHLHHNLDVMHIKKNIYGNLLGTLLNLEWESKDKLKSRQDHQQM